MVHADVGANTKQLVRSSRSRARLGCLALACGGRVEQGLDRSRQATLSKPCMMV